MPHLKQTRTPSKGLRAGFPPQRELIHCLSVAHLPIYRIRTTVPCVPTASCSAGLGVPSRVLEVTRRKACLFWDDHPQLWECRRHKHTFRPSELRALMPCGAGTGGTGPAGGRQQPAGGGESSAPGSEQELARVEARYVRELHAFLLSHPQGIAVRDLPRQAGHARHAATRNRWRDGRGSGRGRFAGKASLRRTALIRELA